MAPRGDREQERLGYIRSIFVVFLWLSWEDYKSFQPDFGEQIPSKLPLQGRATIVDRGGVFLQYVHLILFSVAPILVTHANMSETWSCPQSTAL